jgi:hypothetical protein
MSDRVTYWAIHELLTRLGFTWQKRDVERVIQPPKPKTCVVYYRRASGIEPVRGRGSASWAVA